MEEWRFSSTDVRADVWTIGCGPRIRGRLCRPSASNRFSVSSVPLWWRVSTREPMKRIAILGSTGSIGQSALAVVDAHADRLMVTGLAAGENADRLAEQVTRYQPEIVAMSTGAAADRLRASGVMSLVRFGGT